MPLLSRSNKPKKRQPEQSPRLRVIVFSAQAISFVAVAYVTRLWLPALFAFTILAIGSYYASKHHAADRRIAAVRVATFVALHLAVGYLLVGISGRIAYPQAQFAMLATAIVTFELYSRLNLFSAFAMGLVNLYVAATLSRDVFFGVLLIAFFACWLAFMWLADTEDGIKRSMAVVRVPTPTQSKFKLGGVAPRLTQFAGLGVCCAALIFVITPRFVGRPLLMPLSIQVPMRTQPSSQIINPALPLVSIQGTMMLENSEYYYGFANTLDLSYRGGLSDTLMMYVSSPAWSYWRGYAYDTFDGLHWSQSDDTLVRRTSYGSGIFVLNSEPQRETFVQSFYIVEDMPNILWAGGEPTEIFFPVFELAVDQTGGVRVGEPLRAGTVYSVVSQVQAHEPETLRAVDFSDVNTLSIASSNLQLPDSTTERTRQLAETITAEDTAVYDKVIAIRDYLRETYPYDYFPPPQAPETDSVDQFLFIDQRGVCEHFVSAMIVMLRSLDIPSRFVVGYGSGDYNPFTNFYEVRADDAHAWVEVYFPDHGWVMFDPTPGWTANPQTGNIARSVLSDLFPTFDLAQLPIGQVANMGITVISAIFPVIVIAIIGGVMIAFFIFVIRELRKRPTRPKALNDPARQAIFKQYRLALRRAKKPRALYQTPTEHANLHSTVYPTLEQLAELVDHAAYDPTPIEETDIERTRTLIKALFSKR